MEAEYRQTIQSIKAVKQKKSRWKASESIKAVKQKKADEKLVRRSVKLSNLNNIIYWYAQYK